MKYNKVAELFLLVLFVLIHLQSLAAIVPSALALTKLIIMESIVNKKQSLYHWIERTC